MPAGRSQGAKITAMRKGRRDVLATLGVLLLGVPTLAVTLDVPEVAPPIRLTIEVDWAAPPSTIPSPSPSGVAPGAEIEVVEGRVLGVSPVPGPDGRSLALPEPGPDRGAWRLGSGASGRARVRVEAPVGSNLMVRAGGQAVRIPILSVLEAPQQTTAGAPIHVGVERLAWDALEVDLGVGDGTVAPGAQVPLSLGFNILTPEPAEVAVRLTAELRPIRGGDPLWTSERREVVATNALDRPTRTLSVPAPPAEGTYVLELRSSWEPTATPEGPRLVRWLRRRRGGSTGAAPTSIRRATLAVVAPGSPAAVPAGQAEELVDSVDLGRSRGSRPLASGRAPPSASGRLDWPIPEGVLAADRRLDLVRTWIGRGTTADPAQLGPADANGLAWAACSLRVVRPGRPHRLALTVVGGHPEALGVALIAPGGPGQSPRLLLDACASGFPILDGGPIGSFSWPVWPDAEEPILILVNRGGGPVRLGSAELFELPDGSPAPPPANLPAGPTRSLIVHLADPHGLDRFGGVSDDGLCDPLNLARNLAAYAASCGASAVVLPRDRPDRASRSAMDGQADEDSTGPERFDLLLRVLGRSGLDAWVEVRCDGRLPGLPAPEDPEAVRRGLVRLDAHGMPDGPAYHPLNPEVQKAMGRLVVEAIGPRRVRPNLAGILIRLGPGPTLLGGPGTGFDDATFARFLRANRLDVDRTMPGLGSESSGRFAARQQFLSGPGRLPWLTWRARELGALYAELARAVDRAAPGAVLAVATPGLDDGAAGAEARRGELAGLPPEEAWRAVGFDLGLESWPAGEHAPIVLRGIGPAADDLGHDLAVSPELDAQVAARPNRGLLLAAPPSSKAPAGDDAPRLSAGPIAEGPAGDEPLGHALAAFDARWVILSGTAVVGQEERIRRFATVFRALPAPSTPGPPSARGPSGMAVRAIEAGGATYLALANDTPYPTRLETVLAGPSHAPVVDLGRNLALVPRPAPGGRSLVLDLPPFGVAAVRVGAPGVRVASARPYHPSAVLAGLEARKDDLSRTLARLNRFPQAGEAGPRHPGFEPGFELVAAGGAPRPRGWQGAGAPSTALAIDPGRSHSGRASLRLEAPTAPGAALSDPFSPPDGPALDVRAWLLADRPETPVRLRLEGERDGRLLARQVDLVAGVQWSSAMLSIADLPTGGLDRARLRFELLGPGRLWIDDPDVSGRGLTEPERRNACRTLLAALQAYREQRLADFARLANSHWARQADAALPESEPDRTGLRTGDASALPPGRRLR